MSASAVDFVGLHPCLLPAPHPVLNLIDLPRCIGANWSAIDRGRRATEPVTKNMEIDEERSGGETNYAPVTNESFAPNPGSDDCDAASSPPSIPFALIAALPSLFMIGFGAGASVYSMSIYISQLMLTMAVLGKHAIEQPTCVRWFIGLVMLGAVSSFKSACLLASCDNMVAKAILYATTALWECSNAAPIFGGAKLLEKYGIITNVPEEIMKYLVVYSMAPCQVKFAKQGEVPIRHASRGGKLGKRTIHIVLCTLGVAAGYFLFVRVETIQAVITSFILFELEYMAFMTSMSVVLLDIPSHLWQIVYNFLESTLQPERQAALPHVILPYGWIYSAQSTRQFWSRWSRPAMQVIRYMWYYPLGGKARWYLSIPVMFLLNASGHFDLSYALVGDRAEIQWLALFGSLAAAAMMEVMGDKFFAGVDSDGNASFPLWYRVARGFLAHATLRIGLFIIVHKCFQTSLSDLLGGEHSD